MSSAPEVARIYDIREEKTKIAMMMHSTPPHPVPKRSAVFRLRG